MSNTTYGKNLFLTLLTMLTLTMLSQFAEAGSPVIIRHDAHLMEKDIRINLAWQSDEPITKIIVSAGKEQIVLENIDNERNESGYNGETNIVVPAYLYSVSGEQSMYMSRQSSSPFQQNSMEMYANSGSPANEVVQYTLQIVDEVNQRSTLLKDKVRREELSHNVIRQPPQLKSNTGTVTINAKDPLNTAINTTIGLIGKNGQVPEIKNVKVINWTDNRVSFSFDASDDKGVAKVVYEVRNDRGDITSQNTIECNSEKLCLKQSDPFALNAGSYVLSVIAVDTDNNNSIKREQSLHVQGSSSVVQQPVPQNLQQTIQQPPQQTSPVSAPINDPGVIYENQ